jgi:RNA polymerase sigma-70 factor (ECF subfamily)
VHDFAVNSLCPTEDAALIQGLRLGSPRAFETLLDLYEQPIYRFVYRLLQDPCEAPDVTQDVFVKVFRKIGEFRGDCNLKGWIYRIAVHEASNRRRWFVRHRNREVSAEALLEGDLPGAEWLIDRRGSPFDVVMRKELGSAISDAIGELDERLQVAVILRDVEGLRYSEIADTLQISLGTVKSRILRGREALKSKLQRRLAVDLPGGYLVQAE